MRHSLLLWSTRSSSKARAKTIILLVVLLSFYVLFVTLFLRSSSILETLSYDVPILSMDYGLFRFYQMPTRINEDKTTFQRPVARGGGSTGSIEPPPPSAASSTCIHVTVVVPAVNSLTFLLKYNLICTNMSHFK